MSVFNFFDTFSKEELILSIVFFRLADLEPKTIPAGVEECLSSFWSPLVGPPAQPSVLLLPTVLLSLSMWVDRKLLIDWTDSSTLTSRLVSFWSLHITSLQSFSLLPAITKGSSLIVSPVYTTV
uniref:Uncharacterized protein n=1 Tax=Amphimedon queenslandica TaxID=400682 RepID=A0A1X7UA63_AMPQE